MFITTLTIITLFCVGYFLILNFSKGREQCNKSLVVFLFVAACHQIIICSLKVWSRDELYFGLSLPFGLLFGPAILFLSNRLEDYPSGRKIFLHFTPFIISVILFGTIGLKQWLFYRYVEIMLLTHLLSFVHFSVYMTYLSLKKQLKTGESIFRLMHRYGTKAYLSIFLVFLLIVEILLMTTYYRHVVIHEIFVLTFFLTFLMILSLIYRSDLNLAAKEKSDEDVSFTFCEEVVKSEINSLPMSSLDKRERLYRQRLKQFIDTKGYLDTELNKEKFCHQLGIPLNNISPFLKKEYGKGFNAFINYLRVNYAAAQLKNTEIRTTVDHLSFVCGFNSRASFYRSFHSEFGCTPLQFCKNVG